MDQQKDFQIKVGGTAYFKVDIFFNQRYNNGAKDASIPQTWHGDHWTDDTKIDHWYLVCTVLKISNNQVCVHYVNLQTGKSESKILQISELVTAPYPDKVIDYYKYQKLYGAPNQKENG